jgi:uncharacterized RDD family membrane protein YckC
MKWYYAEGGKQIGGIDEAAWAELLANGTIKPDTLVWREGMPAWVPYGQLSKETGTAAHCAECGKVFPPDDLIEIAGRPICAGCKPIALQKLREGVAVPGTFHYAGFWIRGGAKLIDGVLMFVVSLLVGLGTELVTGGSEPGSATEIVGGLLSFMIQMAISVGYSVWFLSKYGATLGKMALGLRVIRSDGGSLTVGRAVGRTFADYLSGMILYIGYIMAAFDDQKQALHDRICDTRVIRK